MAARGTIDATATDEACEDPRHRLCAVTRLPRPTGELIRFVEGPDGAIVPDLRCKLPGRGVWVTADRQSVEAALKTRAFQRSLKHPVTVDPALCDLIDRLLQKLSLDALSFANKAGAIVFGFDRVGETIDAGRVLVLVHAKDAAAGGVGKLEGRFFAAKAQKPAAPSIDCYSNEQLSLALGRPNVVHAALFDAPAARNFIEQTERLLRFRFGLGFEKSPETGLKDGTIRHE
jgi:uncharacterized protein